jgi:4-oxalocrotonate tautomerase
MPFIEINRSGRLHWPHRGRPHWGQIRRPRPIKVIEGVFTPEEKRELVERVSEAVIAVEGEALRPLTHTAITETPSGEWAVGGAAKTAEDVDALRSVAAAA